MSPSALVNPETEQEQTSLAPGSAGEWIEFCYVGTRYGVISTDTFPSICGSTDFFIIIFNYKTINFFLKE